MLICSTLLLFVFSCITEKPANITKIGFDFAARQLTVATKEIDKAFTDSSLINPRSTNSDGALHLVAAKDWTSGFFPGELWYLFEYTKNPEWERLARKHTHPLEKEKLNGKTHDMGFKMYCSFGNGYRLTHDENYKNILMEAAYTLISRYNPTVKAIRSWDHSKDKWQYPVIIDNMMNLELLFWAFGESRDSVFYNIAVNHACTTMKNHFRPDYSSYHVVDYDTITGNVLKKNTHQGYSDESAWARGQAWAIYGYTMCYRETKNIDFLNQAKNVANYIFTNPNLPPDLIPYWDYNAPEIPNAPKDVSAATCTASALYELSLYDSENESQYKKWADKILINLMKNDRAAVNTNRGFLLLHSTGTKPSDLEVDVPLVYADYYFLEALLRKHKLETSVIFK
ncbi:MAG: glycoside hydrolase family 88 protein [Candidatus Symbiothrix sp.]|nr:glycoside hydrolase family 88 protein [Candidatus Symbiothrix sp.]